MALSDCEKCWMTPCECGHDYRHWTVERLISLRDKLNAIIASKQKSSKDDSDWHYNHFSRGKPHI